MPSTTFPLFPQPLCPKNLTLCPLNRYLGFVICTLYLGLPDDAEEVAFGSATHGSLVTVTVPAETSCLYDEDHPIPTCKGFADFSSE